MAKKNPKEEKKKLMSRADMTKEEVNLFLGHGHAKGRNTVMYYAIKYKMDYDIVSCDLKI